MFLIDYHENMVNVNHIVKILIADYNSINDNMTHQVYANLTNGTSILFIGSLLECIDYMEYLKRKLM